MTTHQPLRRRLLVAALAAGPALLLHAKPQASTGRRPTPAQTEGPFYPVELPADTDFDLLRNGSLAYPEGQAVWLEGTVTDPAGRPLAGAQVEIWQCDQAGHYHHPGDGGKADRRFQGFGRVTVGQDGSYRFRTIRPAPYSGRTPHIHLKVRLGGREVLTTQVYVAGEPRNRADFLWNALDESERAALTVPFRQSGDMLKASFPIVVAV